MNSKINLRPILEKNFKSNAIEWDILSLHLIFLCKLS